MKIMIRYVGGVLAALLLVSSCRKSGDGGVAAQGDAGPQSAAVQEAALAKVKALGFAARVPKDADLFFATYGVDQGLMELLEEVEKWFPDEKKAEGAPGDPRGEDPASEVETGEQADAEGEEPGAGSPAMDWDEVRKVLDTIGGEQFVYVGGGFGKQSLASARIYQDLAATMYGTMLASLLEYADESGFDDLGGYDFESAGQDVQQKVIDLVLGEKLLFVPTVMVGWRPEESARERCLEFSRGQVEAFFADQKEVEKVRFEAHGGEFSGFVFKGDVLSEKMKAAVEEVEDPEEAGPQLSKEQQERLAEAIGKLEITVASGVVDGYVVVYLGQGEEGLRLVSEVEESLASAEALAWTTACSAEVPLMVGYASVPLLQSLVELSDSSKLWEEMAKAVRSPIQDVRTVAGLLEAVGRQSGVLAGRDVRPWTMALVKDRGFRIETRGGWLSPGLDYDRPLRMEAAALATKPMLRYHRMQNRERLEQEWRMVEMLGSLVAAVSTEVIQALDKKEVVGPVAERVFAEFRELARMYREEFHPGIGDEVAFLMDLKGEIPPIPGIAQEVIDQFQGPRLLYARPVLERAKVAAAGASIVKQWRRLTAELSEEVEFDIPAIIPQKIESNGIATWYPLAPFIGGDFVPGVSVNDALWMMGSSRAQVADFATTYQDSPGEGLTGEVFEFQFAPLREWWGKVYEANKEEADATLEEAMDEVHAPDLPDGFFQQQVKGWFQRPETLRYRHWKEDGMARSSLHLILSDPAEEQRE